jgi:hypothetical protein
VEIYCLGLLLALRERGWTIGWAVATDGQGALPDGAAPDLRRAEALAAGERVGVTPLLLGLVDGALDYTAGSLAKVRDCLRDFEPTVVVTHSPNDYHADHRVLSRLVADTCPAGVGLVYCDTMLGVGFRADPAGRRHRHLRTEDRRPCAPTLLKGSSPLRRGCGRGIASAPCRAATARSSTPRLSRPSRRSPTARRCSGSEQAFSVQRGSRRAGGATRAERLGRLQQQEVPCSPM